MKAIVHDFEVKRAVVLEQNEAALIEIGELPATHGIDPADDGVALIHLARDDVEDMAPG